MRGRKERKVTMSATKVMWVYAFLMAAVINYFTIHLLHSYQESAPHGMRNLGVKSVYHHVNHNKPNGYLLHNSQESDPHGASQKKPKGESTKVQHPSALKAHEKMPKAEKQGSVATKAHPPSTPKTHEKMPADDQKGSTSTKALPPSTSKSHEKMAKGQKQGTAFAKAQHPATVKAHKEISKAQQIANLLKQPQYKHEQEIANLLVQREHGHEHLPAKEQTKGAHQGLKLDKTSKPQKESSAEKLKKSPLNGEDKAVKNLQRETAETINSLPEQREKKEGKAAKNAPKSKAKPAEKSYGNSHPKNGDQTSKNKVKGTSAKKHPEESKPKDNGQTTKNKVKGISAKRHPEDSQQKDKSKTTKNTVKGTSAKKHPEDSKQKDKSKITKHTVNGNSAKKHPEDSQPKEKGKATKSKVESNSAKKHPEEAQGKDNSKVSKKQVKGNPAKKHPEESQPKEKGKATKSKVKGHPSKKHPEESQPKEGGRATDNKVKGKSVKKHPEDKAKPNSVASEDSHPNGKGNDVKSPAKQKAESSSNVAVKTQTKDEGKNLQKQNEEMTSKGLQESHMERARKKLDEKIATDKHLANTQNGQTPTFTKDSKVTQESNMKKLRYFHALSHKEGHDKEKILKLLEDNAQIKMISDSTYQELPSWSQVTAMYGSKPKFVDQEQCKVFQSQGDLGDKYIGIAGAFNSGTNIMAVTLQQNCKLHKRQEKYGKKQLGIRYQVPYGKHVPPKDEEFRTNNVGDHSKGVDPKTVLPAVMVRDPFRWLQSMCLNYYTSRWPRVFRPSNPLYHCPNLFPTDAEKAELLQNGFEPIVEGADFVKETPGFEHKNDPIFVEKQSRKERLKKDYVAMSPEAFAANESTSILTEEELQLHHFPVTIGYNNNFTQHHHSLVHLWNEFLQNYHQQKDYPHIFVRFEDLLYFPDEVITQVCECAGGSLIHRNETTGKALPVRVQADSQKVTHDSLAAGKGQLEHTGYVKALIRYANVSTRFRGMTSHDLQYARRYLDKDLMDLFGYSLPPAPKAQSDA